MRKLETLETAIKAAPPTPPMRTPSLPPTPSYENLARFDEDVKDEIVAEYDDELDGLAEHSRNHDGTDETLEINPEHSSYESEPEVEAESEPESESESETQEPEPEVVERPSIFRFR